MGRTHKTLTYEQERKLHRDGQITKVKGVHSWDRRTTSNRPPVHVDAAEEEDLDDENPLYERILQVFKNGISDTEFVESFISLTVQNDPDEKALADIMVDYLEQIITDENVLDVPDFGDMTQYHPDDFRDYVEDYFKFISESSMDGWIETYSSI